MALLKLRGSASSSSISLHSLTNDLMTTVHTIDTLFFVFCTRQLHLHRPLFTCFIYWSTWHDSSMMANRAVKTMQGNALMTSVSWECITCNLKRRSSLPFISIAHLNATKDYEASEHELLLLLLSLTFFSEDASIFSPFAGYLVIWLFRFFSLCNFLVVVFIFFTVSLPFFSPVCGTLSD